MVAPEEQSGNHKSQFDVWKLFVQNVKRIHQADIKTIHEITENLGGTLCGYIKCLIH